MTQPLPNALDMFHGDNREALPDFAALKKLGIVAVMHKLTQGLQYVDPQYAKRMSAAIKAGMLWGAYHFLTSDDPVGQADHFMLAVGARGGFKNIAVIVDYEKSARTPDLNCLYVFVHTIEQRLPGCSVIIYSSDLIRETLTNKTVSDQNIIAWFARHRLWLAEYGNQARVPWPWSHFWGWQFSETGNVAGIAGHVDLNYLAQSETDLIASWYSGILPAPQPAKDKPMGSIQGTLQDIEDGIKAIQGFLPTVLNMVAPFFPPAAALLKFLPLLQMALQAVQTISDATGASVHMAAAQTMDHLTPGQPNSAALNGPAGP